MSNKRVHMILDEKEYDFIKDEFNSFTVGIRNLIAAYKVGKENADKISDKDSLAFLALVTKMLSNKDKK